MRGLMDPYAVVGPYSTWESAISLVVQVIVAEEEVMPEAVGPVVKMGGVVSVARLMLIVRFGDVAVLPAASEARMLQSRAPVVVSVTLKV